MAEIVYSDVPGNFGVTGKLFQGLKFWLSHKVPQRSRFVNDVEANGGEIVKLEKQANVRIVDHARKEAPRGSHSYQFIERSIRNGVLESLDDHTTGQSVGAIRSVGSVVQPPKASRNRYTADDDRILWDWVTQHPQKGGGDQGNEIYKQLGAKHPQHTWQSWRDHWIKQLRDKPRPFQLPHNAPPTPPSADDTPTTNEGLKKPFSESANKVVDDPAQNFQATFTEEDAEALLSVGAEILKIPEDKMVIAWRSWASEKDKEKTHTARQWQEYWEEYVRPRHLRRQEKQARSTISPQSTTSRLRTPSPTKNTSASATSPFSPYVHENLRARSPIGIGSSKTYSPSIQAATRGRSCGKRVDVHVAVGELNATVKNGAARSLPSTPGNRKRKQIDLQEQLPSSSPLDRATSPKRGRYQGGTMPLEIASTPEGSPAVLVEPHDSPIMLKLEDESDMEELYAEELKNNEFETPLSQQISETLSEPGRPIGDTQAVFLDPTQAVDLDIPPPDEGWDDEDPEIPDTVGDGEYPLSQSARRWIDAEAEDELSEPDSREFETEPAIPETQAMLREQTPALDLTIADPDGGWENLRLSSPPPVPGSPRPNSEVSDTDDQLQAWIDAQVALGVTADQATWVLMRTSLDTNLANETVKHLASKGEIPQNSKGVWTEADDRDVRSTDARKIERLQGKHGETSLERRYEFLSEIGIESA